MFIPKHIDLVFFAFPKCASEWVRNTLKLECGNHYDINNWEKCASDYCHVEPSRYVREHNIDINSVTMFAIVRNPYERLLSCYIYGVSQHLPYARDHTFYDFIKTIYDSRENLRRLPMHWMYLPVEQYFGQLTNTVRFFQMENLSQLCDFLKNNYDIDMDSSKKMNTTKHNDYHTYYNESMIYMVHEVYRYEINRFGYKFNG